jgi:hypothetical protein
MSNYYRPNTSGANWRQREIEKAKARKEAEQKAKEEAEKRQYANTEQNFPTVIGAGAGNTHVAFDQTFSNLAKDWQKSDEYEMARQAYETEKARKARNEFKGIYIHRFREGRVADVEEEEDIHRPYVAPSKVDYEGWEEVKGKARKTPRELTEAELAKKYEDAASESEGEDKDMNPHLFDKRRRDELY